MGKSKIEWLQRPGTIGESWSPVTGCTKISTGCKNCYAERMSKRLAGHCGYPEAPHQFDVTLHPDKLEQPLKWKKPRTVFVVSMGDLFHIDVSIDFIQAVINVIAQTPQHTYIILTKRPEEMRNFFFNQILLDGTFFLRGRYSHNAKSITLPLPNLWLGASIEKPKYCYRAQYLRDTPAAVRFISFEPLLASMSEYPGVLDDMDWVICGGESGPGARPMHPDWAQGLRDQCDEAEVPFFFK